MHIEIDTLEISYIIFCFFFFKWLFRFGVIGLLVKLISSLKDKGAGVIKEFEEKIKGGKEGE